MTIKSLTRNNQIGQALWKNPGLFAFNALLLFLDRFGTSGLYWRPETIEMELCSEFGIDDVDDGNFCRLMVGIDILTSTSFFTSPTDFANFCCVLSGTSITPTHIVLPTSSEIAWGITEGLLISPADTDAPFSPEVVEFVRKTVELEGIVNPPDVLRIVADPDLPNRISYEFSSDPLMFKAIFEVQQEKASAIELFLKGRVQSLITQLAMLPLKNAKNHRSVVEQLVKWSEKSEQKS